MEGSWIGPDKVSHFLFCIAVTFAGAWWMPKRAALWWIGSLLLGLVWEASNYWFVFEGTVGVSYLDGIAFAAGWILAGLELYLLRRRHS